MTSSVERISAMVGSKVSIRTNEGTYSGIVSKLSDPTSKVVLEKVKCLSLPQVRTNESTSKDVPRPLHADKTSNEREISKENISTNNIPRQQNIAAQRNTPEFSYLTQESILFDGVTESSKLNHTRPSSYVVIERFGEIFEEAISLIQRQNVIGFGMDGIELGRHGQLCLISIATGDIVLMFDMMSLNCIEAFEFGLKEIIESPNILKIMHDCRRASDILFHQFDVKLQNIYDIQVMDIMISRNANGGVMPKYVRNLASLLLDFLRFFPPEVAFYHIRKNALDKDRTVWSQRPLPAVLYQSAALSVRYLRELRVATQEAFLGDFTRGVDIYLDLVRSASRVDNMPENSELLPKAFLQFEQPRSSTAGRDNHSKPLLTVRDKRLNSTLALHGSNQHLVNGHAKQDYMAKGNSRMPSEFCDMTSMQTTITSPLRTKHDTLNSKPRSKIHGSRYRSHEPLNLFRSNVDDQQHISDSSRQAQSSGTVMYPAGYDLNSINENPSRRINNPSHRF